MRIQYLILFLSNLLFAQHLSISSEQLDGASILVRIKNNSSTNTYKILLDKQNLEYSCDYKINWPSPHNFARLAICFDYPKRYNYQTGIVPNKAINKMFGVHQNLSILEYIEKNTICIKPLEEKEIIYQVSDFNNSLFFKKYKKFTVKSKIIYFGKQTQEYLDFSELHVKYYNKDIVSNTFDLTIKFFKP